MQRNRGHKSKAFIVWSIWYDHRSIAKKQGQSDHKNSVHIELLTKILKTTTLNIWTKQAIYCPGTNALNTSQTNPQKSPINVHKSMIKKQVKHSRYPLKYNPSCY